MATSHYLNQWCPDSLTHICGTRGNELNSPPTCRLTPCTTTRFTVSEGTIISLTAVSILGQLWGPRYSVSSGTLAKVKMNMTFEMNFVMIRNKMNCVVIKTCHEQYDSLKQRWYNYIHMYRNQVSAHCGLYVLTDVKISCCYNRSCGWFRTTSVMYRCRWSTCPLARTWWSPHLQILGNLVGTSLTTMIFKTFSLLRRR